MHDIRRHVPFDLGPRLTQDNINPQSNKNTKYMIFNQVNLNKNKQKQGKLKKVNNDIQLKIVNLVKRHFKF